MNLKYSRSLFGLLILFGYSFISSNAQSYYSPKELVGQMESIAKTNSTKVKLHQLAVSPGGNPIILVEIGNEVTSVEKKTPAIFVIANPDGINLISSNASVSLVKQLLSDEKKLKFTWYILPTLNPDAQTRYFNTLKWENPRNSQKINDDQDDAIDEDGPDDLNNDGFISEMRVKDPQGIWIADASDPRLLRKADFAKGEKGIYTLYTEGIDNDGDGIYNEDPEGGTNTGINFPHLFQSFNPSSGQWPGSTPETYALMKFIFSHPEIAATFTFGSTNFCLVPPEGGRKGSVDLNNITIPNRYLEMLNAERGKTYTMDEVMEMVKPMVPPGVELTPSLVANFLGLGAVINPLPEDLVWYKELSEQYNDFLKKAKFNVERLDPEKAKDGSFELWSYYHLGIPTFSFNFFTLPKLKEAKKEDSGITMDKLEGMSSEEVIVLGEDKINAFLKDNNAPEQFKAQRIIDMLKGGQATPKQMVGMLKNMPKPKKTSEVDQNLKALVAYSDKNLEGKGFINWTPYKHTTLGDVEIGGIAPYTYTTPVASKADSLISIQLPWIFNLVDKLPVLRISDFKVKSMGANVYSIDIWVENTKYLPFPTAMGKRNNQPAPAILTLDASGIEFLNGIKRTPIKSIDGIKTVKISYVIRLAKGGSINANLESKFAGNDSKEIKL